MKALNKSPHYLVRNLHSFCFRANVPKDLQRIVGKKELRYTLKTGYVGVARVKAQLLAAQVRQIFLCLRKGGRRVDDLTDNKIRELVQQYLKEYIQGLESRYYEEDPRATIHDRNDLYQYLGDLDLIKSDIVQYLGIGEYSTVEGIAARILQQNGIEATEKGSAEYVKLCRGLLRAQLQGIEIERQQMSSGFVEAPDSLKEQPLPSPPITFGRARGPLISEVIDLYAKEAESNWTAKTKDETLSSLRLFLEVVGDEPISLITREKIGGFKQTLLRLPPNIKKTPEYRNKSIEDIIKMDVPKKMSPSTVTKHLTRIASLFEYARRNGLYEPANPATGMNPKEQRRAHEARAPFTKEELIKLFCSEDYLQDKHKQSFQFYMPILALFTGARVNELAQLHLSDIREADDGVWVFDINDEDEKQLKAKASRRIIPIHPFLLEDLKFLSWVDRLKAKGEQRLFHELKKERDGYGRTVSRWFNEKYRQKCGIVSTDGRKRDFHSFRATFITQLAHQKVHREMRLQVEGHAPAKDMTMVYADPFPAKQLYDEVISKLDYGIDLRHLSKSKFVLNAYLGIQDKEVHSTLVHEIG